MFILLLFSSVVLFGTTLVLGDEDYFVVKFTNGLIIPREGYNSETFCLCGRVYKANLKVEASALAVGKAPAMVLATEPNLDEKFKITLQRTNNGDMSTNVPFANLNIEVIRKTDTIAGSMTFLKMYQAVGSEIPNDAQTSVSINDLIVEANLLDHTWKTTNRKLITLKVTAYCSEQNPKPHPETPKSK